MTMIAEEMMKDIIIVIVPYADTKQSMKVQPRETFVYHAMIKPEKDW